MAYIDKQYYDDEFQGESIEDDAEFNRVAKRASEIIDQLTMYKLAINGLESLTDFQQEQVKKATAAQVEFYQLKGGYAEVESGEDFSNFSIGSFTYSKGGASDNKQADRISPSTMTYLEPTGLLYRGIGTYG